MARRVRSSVTVGMVCLLCGTTAWLGGCHSSKPSSGDGKEAASATGCAQSDVFERKNYERLAVTVEYHSIFPLVGEYNLNIDYNAPAICLATVSLGSSGVQTLGLQPRCVWKYQEGESDYAAAAFFAGQGNHEWFYMLTDKGKLFVLFEGSDIPGTLDGPRTPDDLLILFRTEPQAFTQVRPELIYINPNVQEVAQRHGVAIPENIRALPEHTRLNEKDVGGPEKKSKPRSGSGATSKRKK